MIRERYCQDCGRVFTAEDEDDRVLQEVPVGEVPGAGQSDRKY